MTPPDELPDVASLMHAALVAHADYRLDEAEAIYRRVLARHPDHVRALGMLVLALSDGPDPEAAEPVIMRHLALRPENGPSLHRLGRLRTRRGQDEEAVELLARAAAALPDLAPIQNDLGVAMHRLGRRREALAALDRAVAADPAYAIAHGNRGGVLLDMGRFAEALDAQLMALSLIGADPGSDRTMILQGLMRAAEKAGRLHTAEAALRAELDAGRNDPDTLVQLAQVLDRRGRPAEALGVRNEVARRQGLRRTGDFLNSAATVLVLAGAGGGLVPIRYLVDTEIFATLSLILLTAGQPDAPLGGVRMDGVQGADVVFSVLGDVDHDCGQFDGAIAFCADLGKPVLNPPEAVLRTGRHQAAALFAGIPAMVTPVVRYAEIEDLAALPMDAPLLVRPVGDHGGDNLVLLRTEADKAAYLQGGPRGRRMVSPFHDFRSPDGHWRKYRFIFIDRRVHPYHLAIGDDWLVHYWRAEMQRSPWKMAEEERFLDDWRGVFGEKAAAAVEEAARRLDLDYGGMDCTLTADGELLLFEANACILLHLDEPAETFGYKHRHTPPIREAFTRMVLERAACSPARGGAVTE